jgi:hypothetical protein
LSHDVIPPTVLRQMSWRRRVDRLLSMQTGTPCIGNAEEIPLDLFMTRVPGCRLSRASAAAGFFDVALKSGPQLVGAGVGARLNRLWLDSWVADQRRSLVRRQTTQQPLPDRSHGPTAISTAHSHFRLLAIIEQSPAGPRLFTSASAPQRGFSRPAPWCWRSSGSHQANPLTQHASKSHGEFLREVGQGRDQGQGALVPEFPVAPLSLQRQRC